MSRIRRTGISEGIDIDLWHPRKSAEDAIRGLEYTEENGIQTDMYAMELFDLDEATLDRLIETDEEETERIYSAATETFNRIIAAMHHVKEVCKETERKFS